MLLFLLSLIHSIATRVIKLAHAKSSVALAPALVETYSRLLVYMEIESLGIKGFISKTGLSGVLQPLTFFFIQHILYEFLGM